MKTNVEAIVGEQEPSQGVYVTPVKDSVDVNLMEQRRTFAEVQPAALFPGSRVGDVSVQFSHMSDAVIYLRAHGLNDRQIYTAAELGCGSTMARIVQSYFQMNVRSSGVQAKVSPVRIEPELDDEIPEGLVRAAQRLMALQDKAYALKDADS